MSWKSLMMTMTMTMINHSGEDLVTIKLPNLSFYLISFIILVTSDSQRVNF